MRAFTPWPMSWLEIEGQPVKSGKRRSLICRPTCTRNNPEANKQGIQVATGDGILNLLSLQPAGKKAMQRARPPEFSSGTVCSGQPSGLIVHFSKPGLAGILYL
ncbi:hypothetical protein ACNKHP_10530 [Shigella boydii]